MPLNDTQTKIMFEALNRAKQNYSESYEQMARHRERFNALLVKARNWAKDGELPTAAANELAEAFPVSRRGRKANGAAIDIFADFLEKEGVDVGDTDDDQ